MAQASRVADALEALVRLAGKIEPSITAIAYAQEDLLEVANKLLLRRRQAEPKESEMRAENCAEERDEASGEEMSASESDSEKKANWKDREPLRKRRRTDQ